MKEKRFYSPREVAEMCRLYHKTNGIFGGPVSIDMLRQYEKGVPKNVREIIDEIELEEHTEQRRN